MSFKDNLVKQKDGSYMLKSKTKKVKKEGTCIDCGENPAVRDLLYQYNAEDMVLVREYIEEHLIKKLRWDRKSLDIEVFYQGKDVVLPIGKKELIFKLYLTWRELNKTTERKDAGTIDWNSIEKISPIKKPNNVNLIFLFRALELTVSSKNTIW